MNDRHRPPPTQTPLGSGRPPRYWFVVYADYRRAWRWRLVTRNGRVMARSVRGYLRQWQAVQAAVVLRAQVGWSVITEAHPERWKR